MSWPTKQDYYRHIRFFMSALKGKVVFINIVKLLLLKRCGCPFFFSLSLRPLYVSCCGIYTTTASILLIEQLCMINFSKWSLLSFNGLIAVFDFTLYLKQAVRVPPHHLSSDWLLLVHGLKQLIGCVPEMPVFRISSRNISGKISLKWIIWLICTDTGFIIGNCLI